MLLLWSDLTRFQQHAVTLLSHSDPVEEQIGVELGSIPRGLLPAICNLVERGLVDLKLGWRDTVWVQLTEAGRRIRSTLPSPATFR